MEKFLIAIDGGTTNLRVSLWNVSGECLDVLKSEVGARVSGMEGTNAALKKAIKENMETLLKKNGLSYEYVSSIYACGMLTSNVGLKEIPHISAPAGKKELMESVETAVFPEICPQPIHFIRGVKNSCSEIDLEKIDQMDVMRGEETETAALLEYMPQKQDFLCILPGSHTKFVSVRKDGRIVGCMTTMAGELLAVLTFNSILAGAVGKSFSDEDFHQEMILAGYRAAKSTGISRAAFLTRMLSISLHKKPKECADFLLGVVLEGDIEAVKKSKALCVRPDTRVIIAGKEPLVSALKTLLAEDGYFTDISVCLQNSGKPLSGFGMFIIAKARGDI